IGNLQESMQEEQEVLKRWERKEVSETLAQNGLELKPKKGKDYSSKQGSLWHRITFAAINLHNVRLWKKLKGDFYYSPGAGMAAVKSMPQTWDFTKALGHLDFPVYVIHGDDDFFPVEKQKEWIGKTQNVVLKIVKNAGHVSWIDQPVQVESLIYEYLDKIKK
ncbi:MAG: alpha/beta hydrolase, partial [Planctomycetota bacterium]